MLNLKPQTKIKMEDDVLFEIPEEQLKKMKTQEELEAYIPKLFKHAVQTMLKAEMDEHLGYKKHDTVGKNTGNNRNGSSGKTLKTDIVDFLLDVPRVDVTPKLTTLRRFKLTTSRRSGLPPSLTSVNNDHYDALISVL
jgi:hypothetical protein